METQHLFPPWFKATINTALQILFSITCHCAFLSMVVLMMCRSAPYLDEASTCSGENRVWEEPYCGFQIAFNRGDLSITLVFICRYPWVSKYSPILAAKPLPRFWVERGESSRCWHRGNLVPWVDSILIPRSVALKPEI